MSQYKFGERCDHGLLKRSCELCELIAENARGKEVEDILNKEIRRLPAENDELKRCLQNDGVRIGGLTSELSAAQRAAEAMEKLSKTPHDDDCLMCAMKDFIIQQYKEGK